MARQEALNPGAKSDVKKNFRMPSDANATTCRNRNGAPNASISAAQRKRRTRRLILMGSYLEHVTGNDPDKRDRLIKGLDVFLERDRDRELFELAPRPKDGEIAPIDHTGE